MDELLGKDMHRLIHQTRLDGTPFPVEECPIFRTISTGQGVHVDDEVFRRANGRFSPLNTGAIRSGKGKRLSVPSLRFST